MPPVESVQTELLRALSPCYDCSNPRGGCQEGCPTHLPIADIRRLVANDGVPGLYAGAVLAMEQNPLGAVCVDACSPCNAEVGCRNRLSEIPIQNLHEAVTKYFFRNIDRFVFSELTPNGKKVAIVGDGPSALSAAIKLAASGTSVVIYSESGKIGGLTKTIPRVGESSLQDTKRLIEKFGPFITIEQKKTSSDDLSSFDGVINASGLKYQVPNDSEGNVHKGIHAVEFIQQNKTTPAPNLKGKRVMVIGGGKTAVDAALLAQKLGATVEVFYRRDLGSMDDLLPIIDVGITVHPLLAPEASGESLEHELFVRFQTMEVTGSPEPSTGKRPVNKTPLSETYRANIVLWATPGEVDVDPAYADLKIPLVTAGDLDGGERTVARAVFSGLNSAKDLMSKLGIEEKPILRHPDVDTSAEFIRGQKTDTPFMVAAVPTSDAENINACRAALQQDGCSGIVIKTVTFNDVKIELPAHYMQRVDGDGRTVGMGNADHISRAGITKAIETATALKREFPTKKIIISIMSGTIAGWGELAKMIKDAGLDGIECSFSCPQGNLDDEGAIVEGGGGGMLGQNIPQSVAAAKAMIDAVGPDFPISIKIPTSNTLFVKVAKALYDAGIRYITCANSVHGLVSRLGGSEEIFRPSHNGVVSAVGYTASGITAASLASVSTLAQLKQDCPGLKIWGTGGMMSGKDAIAMLAAGADGVQFGSAIIERGVDVFEEALSVLRWYCHLYGKKAMDIVNSLDGRVNFDRLVAEAPGLVAIHNLDACVGCGNCATTCNEGMHGAVTVSPPDGFDTDRENCEGCGACANGCPVGAIRMVEK